MSEIPLRVWPSLAWLPSCLCRPDLSENSSRCARPWFWTTTTLLDYGLATATNITSHSQLQSINVCISLIFVVDIEFIIFSLVNTLTPTECHTLYIYCGSSMLQCSLKYWYKTLTIIVKIVQSTASKLLPIITHEATLTLKAFWNAECSVDTLAWHCVTTVAVNVHAVEWNYVIMIDFIRIQVLDPELPSMI